MCLLHFPLALQVASSQKKVVLPWLQPPVRREADGNKELQTTKEPILSITSSKSLILLCLLPTTVSLSYFAFSFLIVSIKSFFCALLILISFFKKKRGYLGKKEHDLIRHFPLKNWTKYHSWGNKYFVLVQECKLYFGGQFRKEQARRVEKEALIPKRRVVN